MSRTLHLQADTDVVRPTTIIETAARQVPLCCVTTAMLAELIHELGNRRRAVRWLSRLATETNKPIAVNIETGPDTSTTILLGPPGWSDERLAGYGAGLHEELEAAFGPGTVRP